MINKSTNDEENRWMYRYNVSQYRYFQRPDWLYD